MKIIKDIKYLKMLTRYYLKHDGETKIQIVHCYKNLIDLDEILQQHGLTTKRSILDEYMDNHDFRCSHNKID